MYRRLSSIMFPIMTVLFIGAAYWGYQEHQEKNSVLIKAENQYQRAFHDLTEHVGQLHKELGNTLAVNSTSQGYHRKGLVNVWRLTSEAQNEVNQLPLSMLPFSETDEFLSRISNFAYKTAVRDLTKEPLSADEFKTLKTLYAKSEEIANQLNSMQETVISNHLRWMDAEIALSSAEPQDNNMIVDGFSSVNKQVGGYPEINWGPSVSSMYQKRSMNMLSGPKVSAEEIKNIAAEFLEVSESEIRVVENGQGSEYASYSAIVDQDRNGNKLQMDLTQKGGKLIWFMNTRAIGDKQIDPDDAKERSDSFLEKYRFENMQAIDYDMSDNIIIFTYVSTHNDVMIYPEKLMVKVALDDGQIVGLQAKDYVYEKRDRNFPTPKVTEKEARTALNPELKIISNRLALIDSDLGEEVLCYEFTGRINGSTYRIFINSNTGLEESIEEVSQEEAQID